MMLFNSLQITGQLLLVLFGCQILKAQPGDFSWPAGKRAGLSLSFDDARLSQIDTGLALFKALGAQVTFYVIPENMKPRLEGWREAVKNGHEIGNHTIFHPCTGNFEWSADHALENYSLSAMRAELVKANEQIEEMLGVKPLSFAYTCGNSFVGRGLNTKSYVPLVAELFTSGRGWLNESSNDPSFVDLAQLMGVEMDGKDFARDLKPRIDEAVQKGRWLVLAGHEIGAGGRQTTRTTMLKQLIQYARDPAHGIWLAPVGTIAQYVQGQQLQQAAGRLREIAAALTFFAGFDEGFEADYSRGSAQLFTAPSYEQLVQSQPGMLRKDVQRVEGKGVYGDAIEFRQKDPAVLYYLSEKNVDYRSQDWSGTISLWLSLDPEQDLEPGFCDPIQITDAGYNDAALWVDFSDRNPRTFRMGLYGDLNVWNPKNIPPDVNPDFQNRLLTAKDRPFRRDNWTHVVISFSNLNGESGRASFYINGLHQGDRNIPEPFTWEVAKSRIFLGLNYIGRMDEISIFDRSLTPEEVMTLYQLPGGVRQLTDFQTEDD